MKKISIEKLKLENKAMISRVDEIDSEMRKLAEEKVSLQEKIKKNISSLSKIEDGRR